MLDLKQKNDQLKNDRLNDPFCIESNDTYYFYEYVTNKTMI
jgi:hypothetical protein